MGSLMWTLHEKNGNELSEKLQSIRKSLLGPLAATTMEATGAYSQAYKYICQ